MFKSRKKNLQSVFLCARASRTLLLRVRLLYAISSAVYVCSSLRAIEVTWRVLWVANEDSWDVVQDGFAPTHHERSQGPPRPECRPSSN